MEAGWHAGRSICCSTGCCALGNGCGVGGWVLAAVGARLIALLVPPFRSLAAPAQGGKRRAGLYRSLPRVGRSVESCNARKSFASCRREWGGGDSCVAAACSRRDPYSRIVRACIRAAGTCDGKRCDAVLVWIRQADSGSTL